MEKRRPGSNYVWNWDPTVRVYHEADFANSWKVLFDISDIKSDGWINRYIKLRVETKKDLRAYNENLDYEFVFEEGKVRMVGVSPNKRGAAFFDALEVGATYKVSGKILVRPRNFNYVTQSTQDFDLFFFELHDCKTIALRDTTSPRSASLSLVGIPKILEELSHWYPEDGILEDLEGVKVVDGKVQRYIKCNICKRSIRIDEKPLFLCVHLRCKYRRKEPKVYMHITGLTLEDDNSNQLPELLAFNEACEIILGKEAKDFLHDGEASDLLKRMFNSVLINVRIIVEKPTPENPIPRKVAKYVEVVQRKTPTPDDSPEYDDGNGVNEPMVVDAPSGSSKLNCSK